MREAPDTCNPACALIRGRLQEKLAATTAIYRVVLLATLFAVIGN